MAILKESPRPRSTTPLTKPPGSSTRPGEPRSRDMTRSKMAFHSWKSSTPRKSAKPRNTLVDSGKPWRVNSPIDDEAPLMHANLSAALPARFLILGESAGILDKPPVRRLLARIAWTAVAALAPGRARGMGRGNHRAIRLRPERRRPGPLPPDVGRVRLDPLVALSAQDDGQTRQG